jgi:ATP-dependent 26S proteasome regulatory subunit
MCLLFSIDFSILLHIQGVNKDSYLILEKLPTEYDSRVKAMELDERPTEQYSDIGGLDTQIQEVHTNNVHLPYPLKLL